MSFTRYPKYKPSGVEWLGEVPENWRVKKFRYLFRESSEKIESEVVGPMLSVSGYRGIEVKEYDDENRRRLEEDLIGYRIVRVGQLVVNTMWLNYAGLGVSDHEGHVSPAYRSYNIESELERRFVHHLLRSGTYVKGYTRLLTGVRPNSLQMSREDLMNFPVIVPPLAEQTCIAEFLDRETAKIDGLVAEQRRLMELLKEKRQAVISHAVTRGLNPKAPLKPSGIEWLGDVPAHWATGPVKCVIKAIESGTSVNSSDEPADEGKLGVLKTSCVYTGEFRPEENKTVIEEERDRVSCPLRVGTLIVSRMNTPDLIGAAGYVSIAPDNIYLPDRLWQISMKNCDGRFVHYWTCTVNYRAQVEAACTGTSSSMKNLGQDQFRMFAFAVPPLTEQSVMVAYLDAETAKFDTLTAEAQRAIDLLQERRTALISAAVTGQIDLRGVVDGELQLVAEPPSSYGKP